MIRVALDGNQAALDPKITPPGKNSADKPPASKGVADANPTDANPTDVVEIEKPSPTSTLLTYGKTWHTGIYTLSWRDEKSNPRSLRFAVNPPQSESDLEPLAESAADGTARQSQADRAALRLRRRGPQRARRAKSGDRWPRFCWGCWAWKRCLPSGSEGNDSDAARLLAIPAERRAGPLDRRGRHAPGLAQLAAARHCATVALGRRRRRGLDSRSLSPRRKDALSRRAHRPCQSAIPDDGRRARDAARAGDHFHEARDDPFTSAGAARRLRESRFQRCLRRCQASQADRRHDAA